MSISIPGTRDRRTRDADSREECRYSVRGKRTLLPASDTPEYVVRVGNRWRYLDMLVDEYLKPMCSASSEGGPWQRTAGEGTGLGACRALHRQLNSDCRSEALRCLRLPQLPPLRRLRRRFPRRSRPHRGGGEAQGHRVPDHTPAVPRVRERRQSDACVCRSRRSEPAEARSVPRSLEGTAVGHTVANA